MIAAALVLWRRGWPVAAGLLLAVAIYSKPYNLWLALPLGLAPLLGWREREDAPPYAGWIARLLEAARRTAVVVLATLALFGANVLVTGELNYQGGERKTFYGDFPFERKGDRDYTFGNTGITMSTNTVGPKVEGQDAPERGAEPPPIGSGAARVLPAQPVDVLDRPLRRRPPVLPRRRGRHRAVPGGRPARPLRPGWPWSRWRCRTSSTSG